VGSNTSGRTLLIGNGVNLCSDTGCKFFSPAAIKQRFVAALGEALPKTPFKNLRIGIGSAIHLVQESRNMNIEALAAKIFEEVFRIETVRTGFFSGNDDQRLKRILKTAAIDSIFLEKGHFKDIEIWEKTVVSINK